MKIEELGLCPGCFNSEKKWAEVKFLAMRDDDGSLNQICIFGDDDSDIGGSKAIVTNYKDNGMSVVEIECPRCHEKIAVNIPFSKEQKVFPL